MLSYSIVLLLALEPFIWIASSECTCLTQYPRNSTGSWQLARWAAFQNLSLPNISHGMVGNEMCSIVVPRQKSGWYCYGATYGLGCKAHDQSLEPDCNVADPPAFCSEKWCYVDPQRCKLRFESTEIFPALDLYYSYAACNSKLLTQGIMNREFVDLLRKRPLRVVYGLQEPPYLEKDADGVWTGVLVKAMKELSQLYSFQLEEFDVSQASLEVHKSMNTACVLDVNSGRADLCVANIWQSAERTLLAQPGPPWWEELLYLITLRKERSTWELMMRIFQPFSFALWILLIVIFLVYAVLDCWADRETDLDDFDGENRTTAGLHSLYMALLGYVSGGPVVQAKSCSARVMTIGFGFFILVTTASYTGGTAEMLLKAKDGPEYKDFKTFMGSGHDFCTFGVALPVLDTLNRASSSRGVKINDNPDAYDYMGDKCKASIMPSFTYDFAHSGLMTPGDPQKHCNKQLVGRALLGVTSSAYVSREYHAAFSYMVTHLKETGRLHEIINSPSFAVPDSVCKTKLGEDYQATEGLSAKSMMGAVVVTTLFFCCGIVMKLAKPCTRHPSVQQKIEIGLTFTEQGADKVGSAVDFAITKSENTLGLGMCVGTVPRNVR